MLNILKRIFKNGKQTRVVVVIIVMTGFYFVLSSLEKRIENYELEKHDNNISIEEKSNQD